MKPGNGVYVAIAQHGNCKVCGDYEDLRYGSCFDCSQFVDGERVSPVTLRLWDSRNPQNEWFASEDGN
jgi:hypothetical protein